MASRQVIHTPPTLAALNPGRRLDDATVPSGHGGRPRRRGHDCSRRPVPGTGARGKLTRCRTRRARRPHPIPRGSGSASSAPGGSVPSWAPRWPGPGTGSSRVSAVSDASRAAGRALLPGVPVRRPPEVARRRRPGPAHRARRRAARPGRRAGRGRRPVEGRLLAHTSGRHGVGGARPADPPRRAAAGAAPGDDVHRPPGRPRPAGRDLLRGHRARAAAARSPRRWWSRWAASRCSSPRTAARSTTRRWPAGPTTWSRWSTRRSTCCGEAGVRRPGPDARAAAVRRAGQRAAARRRRR